MKKKMNYTVCKPMIECEVTDPYAYPSVLAESQCYKVGPKYLNTPAGAVITLHCFKHAIFIITIADYWRHRHHILVLLGDPFDR